MTIQEGSSSGFKVVDRRPFAADGSRKEENPAEGMEAEAAPERESSAPTELESEPQGQYEDDIPGFERLVSYLSTTAMFQIGLIPGPSGERIPPDMPNAKRTIDMLQILQEKTHGNLTAVESRVLEDVLYELRMTFVEMQKRLARKNK